MNRMRFGKIHIIPYKIRICVKWHLVAKCIRNDDEVKDIDNTIAVEIGGSFTKGICDGDEIKDVDGTITINIGGVSNLGGSLEKDFTV